MKTLRIILTIFLLVAILRCATTAEATLISFSAVEMTGATNNVTFNIRAVNNPSIWNQNYQWLPASGIFITTTNGIAYQNLNPGQYTVAMLGLARSFTIQVTNSLSTLDAATLNSSGIVTYSGVQTLIAGANVTVTQTYPGTYMVSATGGGGNSAIVTSTNGINYSPTNGIVISTTTNLSTAQVNYDLAVFFSTIPTNVWNAFVAAYSASYGGLPTNSYLDRATWNQTYGNVPTNSYATAGEWPNAVTNDNLSAVLLQNSLKVNGQLVVTNGGNTPLQVTNSDGSSLAINHVNKSGNNLYTVTDTNSDQTTYDAKDGLLDLQGANGIDFISAGGGSIQVDGGQNNLTNINLLSANTFTGSGSGLTGVPPAAVSTVGATPGYVMTDVGGVSAYAALPPGNSTNLAGYYANLSPSSSTTPVGLLVTSTTTNLVALTNATIFQGPTNIIGGPQIIYLFVGTNMFTYMNSAMDLTNSTIMNATILGGSMSNVVVTPNIYYVRSSGNDSRADANDFTRPWLTFTGALANVVSPAIIDLGVGTFWTANTTNGSVIPSNVSIRGQGVNATSLNQANISLSSTNNISTNCPGLIIGGDNIELHDFTLGTNTGQGQFYFPLELSHGTNLYVHNVTIDGDSDCIYGNSLAFANTFSNSISGGQQPVFLNDDFNSGYDTVVLLASPGTGATNSSIGFHNCTFKVVADPNFLINGNFPSRGIFLEHVTAAVRNCTFSISNVYEAYGIYIAATSGVTNWLTLQNNGITVIGGGSALNSVFVNGANAYTKLDGPFNADQASFGTSAVQLGDAVFGTIGGDGTALTNQNGALSTLLPASLVNSNQAAQIAALSGGGSSGSYNTNFPPLEFGFGNWLLTTNGARFIITNSFNGNLPLELDQYGNVIAGNGFDVGSSAMTASSISSAGYLLLGVYGSFTGINDAIWFTEGSTVATYKLGIQAEDSTDLGFITTNANFADNVTITNNLKVLGSETVGTLNLVNPFSPTNLSSGGVPTGSSVFLTANSGYLMPTNSFNIGRYGFNSFTNNGIAYLNVGTNSANDAEGILLGSDDSVMIGTSDPNFGFASFGGMSFNGGTATNFGVTFVAGTAASVNGNDFALQSGTAIGGSSFASQTAYASGSEAIALGNQATNNGAHSILLSASSGGYINNAGGVVVAAAPGGVILVAPSISLSTNATISPGVAGKAVTSYVGGTNYTVVDTGGGVFKTNIVYAPAVLDTFSFSTPNSQVVANGNGGLTQIELNGSGYTSSSSLPVITYSSGIYNAGNATLNGTICGSSPSFAPSTNIFWWSYTNIPPNGAYSACAHGLAVSYPYAGNVSSNFTATWTQVAPCATLFGLSNSGSGNVTLNTAFHGTLTAPLQQ